MFEELENRGDAKVKILQIFNYDDVWVICFLRMLWKMYPIIFSYQLGGLSLRARSQPNVEILYFERRSSGQKM